MTSYRAAPPRVGVCVGVVWCVCRYVVGLDDLAATDFPAPWGAVSWALGCFTAEFGMGSGGAFPAMATRSSEPSVFPVCGGGSGVCGVGACVCDGVRVSCACPGGGVWGHG